MLHARTYAKINIGVEVQQGLVARSGWTSTPVLDTRNLGFYR